jgi:riboflavin transporter FmnP
MNTKRVVIATVILCVLAFALAFFNIPLVVGNPNLASTPATLAAVFLPWPCGVIVALIKGISVSIFTGRYWVELPVGVGDAFMALFTWWLAKRWNRTASAAVGQATRAVFSSGMVALCISLAVAAGWLTASSSPIPNLTSSLAANFGIAWMSITWPAIVLSILVNALVSAVVILLYSKGIERLLGRRNSAEQK